jgi:hypothetical protein
MLYSMEAVLDGLVPRLVGRERTVRQEFRVGGPVVQLVGGKVSA